MKFGIVTFPGSNCDHDAFYSVSANAGAESVYLWHKDKELPQGLDCIILPGGFSYGDYLRCGSIAQFSPIMSKVKAFADKGGYVLGICNGFQILTEMQMLPGVLLRNTSLNFICRDVYLKTGNNSTAFTSSLSIGEILRIPIAHGEGNYFADEETIKELEEKNRIVFKYSSPDGEITQDANPNGSLNNIAGIVNKSGNVLGMMPHPERYCDSGIGGDDGLKVFYSLMNFVK